MKNSILVTLLMSITIFTAGCGHFRKSCNGSCPTKQESCCDKKEACCDKKEACCDKKEACTSGKCDLKHEPKVEVKKEEVKKTK